MPETTVGTKIFVGNFDPYCTEDDIRPLFEKYGNVMECDMVRNFCFVHMTSPDEANIAIENLNGYMFGGRKLNVEKSSSDVRKQPGMGGSDNCFYCGEAGHWSRECPNRTDTGKNHGGKATKIYVGNLSDSTTEDSVRRMFEAHGQVTECARVKNYCFVHMKTVEEAQQAIQSLKGAMLDGKTLTIESSVSRPGSRSECYNCGKVGHIKMACPQNAGGGGVVRRGGGPGSGSVYSGYDSSYGGGVGRLGSRGGTRGTGGPMRGGRGGGRGIPLRPAPYAARGGRGGAVRGRGAGYYGGGGGVGEYYGESEEMYDNGFGRGGTVGGYGGGYSSDAGYGEGDGGAAYATPGMSAGYGGYGGGNAGLYNRRNGVGGY